MDGIDLAKTSREQMLVCQISTEVLQAIPHAAIGSGAVVRPRVEGQEAKIPTGKVAH